MKTIKIVLLVLTIIFNLNYVEAQQYFSIHQDNVKPSMIMEYEQTAKKFHDACLKHKPDAQWLTVTLDDFRFWYVTPIENFADLDKNPFSEMAKAMGDDFGKIFEDFDKCYDAHSDFIVMLDEDLTYMPDGISQTPEGENYREFYFIYYTPQNARKVREGMKAVKEMFASKGSKSSYRVYRSGFGSPESYYMVAIAAKDEIELAKKGKANEEVLGPDRYETFNKLMKYAKGMEEVTGNMRPELHYSYK